MLTSLSNPFLTRAAPHQGDAAQMGSGQSLLLQPRAEDRRDNGAHRCGRNAINDDDHGRAAAHRAQTNTQVDLPTRFRQYAVLAHVAHLSDIGTRMLQARA
jgi:hypothetical protein